MDLLAITCKPDGSATSVAWLPHCGSPRGVRAQPGTSVQCFNASRLNWLGLPSGLVAGACTRAMGEGVAGAADELITIPFSSKALDGAPVATISPLKTKVGREPPAALSSMVVPEGRSTAS